MNESRAEYLNGNGNGANGNGNGHDKIFNLNKADDPLLSKVVPAARRKVCENTKICEAARMFFCYLTDMSLLPGVNSRKGVVKFSDWDLAYRFKVSDRTIRNWKRSIESTGEIWLTEKWMKNSFPQTVYNITAIVGQATLPMNIDSADGSLAEDEVFSSNRRRLQTNKRSAAGKFACRVHGVAACEICRHKTPPGIPLTAAHDLTPQKTEEIGTIGKILPPTTAIDFRPPRQMVAAHRGNSLPSPTAIDCRPARKTVAAHDGKRLPLSAENGFRGERQTVADNKETGDVSQRYPETPFKRSTGLNAGNGSGGAKKMNAENHFIYVEVPEAMELWKNGHGKIESSGSGVWWRQSYRASPDLIRRVLAETVVAIKEGKIKADPGKYAVDLWKRWSKDLLQQQLKQKAAARTAAD